MIGKRMAAFQRWLAALPLTFADRCVSGKPLAADDLVAFGDRRVNQQSIKPSRLRRPLLAGG
jgi:hypothetical protein